MTRISKKMKKRKLLSFHIVSKTQKIRKFKVMSLVTFVQ